MNELYEKLINETTGEVVEDIVDSRKWNDIAEQIIKANKEIQTTPITRKNKDGVSITKQYAEVWQRVRAFRKVFPLGFIETLIISEAENSNIVRMRANIYDYYGGHMLSTSEHEEKKSGKGFSINDLDILGNCETSVVGRALGFAGFLGDGGIATVEDMRKVDGYQETSQTKSQSAPINATQTKGASDKQIQLIKSRFANDEGTLSNILFKLGVNSLDELSIKQASDIIGGKIK